MNDITRLFILAIPIACVCRTIVYEEIFREAREICVKRSQSCHRLVERKFFYLFTCEYCFSHYVTAFFLLMTRFHLGYEGWRGYVISFFSLVFIANVYLSLYARIKVAITNEKTEIEMKRKQLEEEQKAKARD